MAEKRSTYILKMAAYAVVACAVVLAFLLLGSKVMVPKDNSPEAGMAEPYANGFLGERPDSIDVVFLGDSETYTSLSPNLMWHEYGFTSYDCASPGQALAYCNTLLHRVFEKQHPKVVVIETSSMFKDLSFSNAISRVLQDTFPLIEYHSRWKSLTLGDFVREPQATWTDDLKGFRIDHSRKPASREDVDKYMAPTEEVEAVTRVNDMYLGAIVDFCRENGATPVLLSTPSARNWSMPKRNGASAWAAEHGVDYLDFTSGADEVRIDWETQTKDGGDHLNYEGAQLVTKDVGKALAQRYNLPDHRADAEYSTWNDTYERYQQLVASGEPLPFAEGKVEER